MKKKEITITMQAVEDAVSDANLVKMGGIKWNNRVTALALKFDNGVTMSIVPILADGGLSTAVYMRKPERDDGDGKED
jgi:hypothetical protein